MELSQIGVFPVKSLGGIYPSEWKTEERGLQYDRRWMLVAPGNRFVSQREIPEMALLQVSIEGDRLLVQHKHKPEVSIYLELNPSGGKELTAVIWKNKVRSWQVDEIADQFFSDVLGQPLRLVYMPESSHRIADPKYAPDFDLVSYADGFPYLILGEASLQDLNQRLAVPVPMNRFRPNLVFKGGTPFVEDSWGDFRVGETRFRAVKPCARCTITTIDQESSVAGKEPLKTLASFRKEGNKVLFGMNLLLREGEKIRLGDSITLL